MRYTDSIAKYYKIIIKSTHQEFHVDWLRCCSVWN
jgi:hypothetical protein